MEVEGKHYRTVWMEEGVVRMIDQPLLPHRFEIVDLRTPSETARAIKDMTVRGAGAIGATAAFGLAQGVLQAEGSNWLESVERAYREIEGTRPTAQNLFYGLKRVDEALRAAGSLEEAREAAVAAARAVADEDAKACERIGVTGAELLRNNARILTHCNAGWLAFVDWGSALAPIFKARRQGKHLFVFVDETRPRCQGSRLTAWELAGEKIEHAVIADNAAGYLMATNQVDLVIVGADRIARNGDVANKIGTYTKAVLAQRHGIPFYVAAPTTTIDFDCPSGDRIPIEERGEEEVLSMFGRDEKGAMRRVWLAPEGSGARNPAFDVTPASLITNIITDKGLIQPSSIASNAQLLKPR